MPSQKQTISGSAIEVVKRRPVGKGAWKMEILELLDKQLEMIGRLRSIRNRHLGNADTQGDVAAALEGLAESVVGLNQLLHYKDGGGAPSGPGSNGNETP